MLEEKRIRDYCIAGIYTQKESIVRKFLENDSLSFDIQLNRMCQSTMTHVLVLYQMSAMASTHNIANAFWFNMKNSILGGDLKQLIILMPLKLRDRKFCVIVILNLVQYLEYLMKEAIKKMHLKDRKESSAGYVSTYEINSDVQRFMGLSISSMRNLFNRKKLNIVRNQPTQNLRY